MLKPVVIPSRISSPQQLKSNQFIIVDLQCYNITCLRPVVLPSYQSKLLQIKEFLRQPRPPSPNQVMQIIGTGVKACEAVPCAIYAFLHCHKLSFKYLIPYAISLGGDTDTIASMAGAIGGAYWGKECIPTEWVDSVEGANHAVKLADGLYALHNNPQ